VVPVLVSVQYCLLFYDVAAVVSTAMAKLSTAGPTTGTSGELSLFDQERHKQAHEIVLAVRK